MSPAEETDHPQAAASRALLDRQTTAKPARAVNISNASDTPRPVDELGCPGAACAALVKREEQAALDEYVGNDERSTAGNRIVP